MTDNEIELVLTSKQFTKAVKTLQSHTPIELTLINLKKSIMIKGTQETIDKFKSALYYTPVNRRSKKKAEVEVQSE